MTMMTRMISAATQLTLLLSAFGGYPVAFKASANFGGSQPAIEVAASDCNFHIFLGPWSRQTACDRAKDFLGKAGLSFTSVPAVPGKEVVTKIGTITIEGWDPI